MTDSEETDGGRPRQDTGEGYRSDGATRTTDVTDRDDPITSESDQKVKQGETYTHAEYGLVEVIGIWRGVHRVDTSYNTKESDMVIVRYATEQDESLAEELADTIDGFLAAIE